MTNKKPWKALGTVLPWFLRALGLLAAVWLLKRTLAIPGGDLRGSLGTAALPYMLGAVLVYGAVNLAAAWRWKLLLNVLGIRETLANLFRLTMAGVFFSNLIPGSISGDLVKMGFLMKSSPGKKTEVAFSIAADRFLGLSGLFLVAVISSAAAAVLYPDTVLQNKVLLYSTAVIWGGAIAMGAAVLLAAMKNKLAALPPAQYVIKFMDRSLPGFLRDVPGRLSMAVELCKASPGPCLKVLLCSAMIHFMLGIMQMLLGKAFHEENMSLLQYMIITQFSNATSLIPATPGGIGIRDAAAAALLGIFQAHPREAMGLIPLSYSAVNLLWALFGALLMVLSPIRNKTNKTDRTNKTNKTYQ